MLVIFRSLALAECTRRKPSETCIIYIFSIPVHPHLLFLDLRPRNGGGRRAGSGKPPGAAGRDGRPGRPKQPTFGSGLHGARLGGLTWSLQVGRNSFRNLCRSFWCQIGALLKGLVSISTQLAQECRISCNPCLLQRIVPSLRLPSWAPLDAKHRCGCHRCVQSCSAWASGPSIRSSKGMLS